MTEKSLTLFVNYRRADDKVFVELLRTHFMFRYGQDNVFMDFDTIPPFADFAEFIKDRVRASDALVMMIGKNWLKLLKDKEAKGEPDYVRMELEEALKHNIPIAPILIQGAQLPDKDDVPESLQPIWLLNIPSISEGRDLLNNIGYIMQGFERTVSEKGKSRKVQNITSVQQLAQLPTFADDSQLEEALEKFSSAVKSHDYPQALVWISYIRHATDAIPLEFELDARERDIQEKLQQQQDAKLRREVCDYQYKFVRHMLKMNDSPEKIKAFVKKIWTIENGYIPWDLQLQLRPIMRLGEKIVVPPKPPIILPQPFDWCYIPEGEVNLYRNAVLGTYPTDAFWISKYPITNRQYLHFVTDRKYQIDKPLEFKESARRWFYSNRPVTYVSQYDAEEFCKWLGNKTGNDVTLPTIYEWQRAAQGNNSQIHPLSGDFNIHKKCNIRESDIDRITSVKRYEGKGDSPFGVVDMIGNVWHWCKGYEGAYGGCCFSDQREALSHQTREFKITSRHAYVGFLLVCHIR